MQSCQGATETLLGALLSPTCSRRPILASPCLRRWSRPPRQRCQYSRRLSAEGGSAGGAGLPRRGGGAAGCTVAAGSFPSADGQTQPFLDSLRPVARRLVPPPMGLLPCAKGRPAADRRRRVCCRVAAAARRQPAPSATETSLLARDSPRCAKRIGCLVCQVVRGVGVWRGGVVAWWGGGRRRFPTRGGGSHGGVACCFDSLRIF